MSTTPTYIYKIAPSNPQPTPASERATNASSPVLPPSALDTKSGFIHMSTAPQIPGTLKHFFSTLKDEVNVVYLLKTSTAKYASRGKSADPELRWESPDASVCGDRPDEGLFPHLYLRDGGESTERRLWLRCGEVESVLEVKSEIGEEGWEGALGKLKGWLV